MQERKKEVKWNGYAMNVYVLSEMGEIVKKH